MGGDWRNEPASEKQKEKLRFFGCSWDEGITKGQASDALDECARQFPKKNEEYYNRPATAEQLAKLRDYLKEDGEEPEDYADEGRPLTYRQAKDLLEDCEMAVRKEAEEKEIAYLDSDEARIDEEMMRIDTDYGEEYREVTRDEVAKAWALVKSRQAALPVTQDLLDALEELFSDFHPKEQDFSRYDSDSRPPTSEELPRTIGERKKIIEEKLFELVADGTCTKEHEKELQALAVQLGFKESFAGELLKQKFTEEFRPIQQRVEKAHVLTDEDVETIERLKKKYAIELTLEGNAAVFRSIYLIESKKQLPPPISINLMLEKDEVAYYSIPTTWHQLHRELKEIAEGVLYVTSNRLLFCGTENTSINLKNIVDGQFYSDFLKIDKNTGKSNMFSMTSAEARYILALVRALK